MKTLILSLATILLALFSNAQDLKIQWSSGKPADNKTNGFFKNYVASNATNVYAKFEVLRGSSRKKRMFPTVILQAIDKKTLKKTGEAVLFDAQKVRKSSGSEMLRYHTTLAYDDLVYVFWLQEGKEKDELHVQTFDANLKKVNKLKKIYEVKHLDGRGNKNGEIFVAFNDATRKIAIGAEMSGKKESTIKIEFKVLNDDLSVSAANKIELPFQIINAFDGLICNYSVGEGDRLLIHAIIRDEANDSEDSGKKKRRAEYITYPVMTIVDMNSGEYKNLPFQFEDKNVFDFRFTVADDFVKFTGFFCDLSKDTKGRTTHGVFTVNIDLYSNTMQSPRFSYFDKALLDEVYSDDKSDQVLASSKRKKKKTDENSISGSYVIEEEIVFDNGEMVLFCSMMNNYATTHCDANGNCITRYFCSKRNVTAFKLDQNGEIVWAKNIDRSYTYGGWNVYDVEVVYDENEKVYYCTYGNELSNETGNEKVKKRKKKDLRLNFEYASFNDENGQAAKKTLEIDKETTPKKERKYLVPTSIAAIDNQFYTHYTKVGRKPSFYLNCLGSLAFWPLAFNLKNPAHLNGTGYYGTIIPKE